LRISPTLRTPVPSPAPFYLHRGFRRVPPDDYNVFCCLSAALTWRTSRARIIRRYLEWIFLFPSRLITYLIRYGPASRQNYRRSITGQIRDMLRLAARGAGTPREYYEYGLSRFSGGPELLDYISSKLHTVVAATCVDRCMDHASATFDYGDKQAFELRCMKHGFACVETITVVSPEGATTISGDPFNGALAHQDIFFKPNRGVQGKGAGRIQHIGDGRFVSMNDGNRLPDGTAVIAYVASLSRAFRSPMLIQHTAVNTDSISALVGNTFSTARIITMLDENGVPEVVFGCLRTAARSDSSVDNYHAGGIAFPIDIETGALGAGRQLNFTERPEFFDRHPLTGSQVKGERLMEWKKARQLALAMHRTFTGPMLIGWDLGFTPEGPIVLEANVPPGLPVVQMERGFLGTRYSGLLAHHAKRILDETEPLDSRWRIGADIRQQANRA
jgi:hypothetical protein